VTRIVGIGAAGGQAIFRNPLKSSSVTATAREKLDREGAAAMTSDAKLGLVAGVLAVLGVAVFGMPQAVQPQKPPTPRVEAVPAPAVATAIPQQE